MWTLPSSQGCLWGWGGGWWPQQRESGAVVWTGPRAAHQQHPPAVEEAQEPHGETRQPRFSIWLLLWFLKGSRNAFSDLSDFVSASELMEWGSKNVSVTNISFQGYYLFLYVYVWARVRLKWTDCPYRQNTWHCCFQYKILRKTSSIMRRELRKESIVKWHKHSHSVAQVHC